MADFGSGTDGRTAMLIAQSVEAHRRALEYWWAEICSKHTSPIEALLEMAMHMYWDGITISSATQEFPPAAEHQVALPVIIRQFQPPNLPYRIDFALSWRGHHGKVWLCAIECDGHDFHERTKGQAEHDRKRDRDLQAAGWLIFRYTGSEIWRDARKCVSDLEAALYSRDAQEEADG